MAFVLKVLALVCQCALFGNSTYDDEHSALLQAGIKNHVGGAEIGNNSKREALTKRKGECSYEVGDTVEIMGLGWNKQDCRGQKRKISYINHFDCSFQVGGAGGCNDEWFMPDSLESAVAEATPPPKVCCYDDQRDWWYDHLEFWPHKDEWHKWADQIMTEDYVVYKGTRSIQGPDDCFQVCLDWESECDWSYDGVECKQCNEVGYTYSWPAANECRVGVGQGGLGYPLQNAECTKLGFGACVAMTKKGAEFNRARKGALRTSEDFDHYDNKNEWDMIKDGDGFEWTRR